ncbi:hypothetical protein R1flu_022850 [Riccia fluitans]|uniref:Uncharacterized protein n=1 Tax=Riccia fluitans TaxID=41844 RepID=A0ABD1XUG1_9MARC
MEQPYEPQPRGSILWGILTGKALVEFLRHHSVPTTHQRGEALDHDEVQKALLWLSRRRCGVHQPYVVIRSSQQPWFFTKRLPHATDADAEWCSDGDQHSNLRGNSQTS